MSKTNIVDDFYSQACKQYSTYETMVIKGFARLMDDHFDPVADKDAFDYARKTYDYLNPSEIAAMDSDNESEGVCGHGLTVNTCPCGCFED
jgi:hypothetical protein